MKIDGINFKEITDIQDLLVVLDTIKVQFEILSENLNENHNNYKLVEKDLFNNNKVIENVIKSIFEVQFKMSDLISNIDTTNLSILSSNDKFILELKNNINTFSYETTKKFNDAVNLIDSEKLSKQLEILFNQKIVNLEKEIVRLNRINDKFKTNNDDLNEKLNDTNEHVVETINQFNKMAKITEIKSMVAAAMIGWILNDVFHYFF